jgi:hypothetical protein
MLASERGPFWLGTNQDPSYVYLTNTLLILDGQPPFHTDHPGTPLQLFGAALFSLKAWADGTEVIHAALENPEDYLSLGHAALLAASVLALLLSGIWIWRTLGLSTALIFQSAPVLSPLVLRGSLWFAPEALLISVTTFLSASILVSVGTRTITRDGKKPCEAPLNILTGVLTATALVCKATFLPLCGLAVLGCRSLTSCIRISVSALIAALALLSPIFSEWERTFQWFSRLATHTGKYGAGSAGVVDLGQFPAHVWNLATAAPLMSFAILLSLMAGLAAWSRRESNRRLGSLGGSLILAAMIQLAAVLFVAKHPHPRYLLPVACSLSLNLGLMALTATLIPSTPRRVCAFAWGSLALTFTCHTVPKALADADELALLRKEQLAIFKAAENIATDHPRFDYFRSPSPPYALQFGNLYARYHFSEELRALHPNYVSFNIVKRKFETFRGPVRSEPIFSSLSSFYLLGDQLIHQPEYSIPFPPGWSLEIVEQQGDYVLHRARAGSPEQ